MKSERVPPYRRRRSRSSAHLEVVMKSHARVMVRLTLLASAAGLLVIGTAHAQALAGEALVKALRQGGYVIVMRHASSPREVPDQKIANADNVNRERQLDEAGRT